PAAIHPCTHLGWFRNHLLWHLTLMHLSRGDYARASRMSRAIFEKAPSSVPGELHDSISLLWRLQLCGFPMGERCRALVHSARDRMKRPGLHFHAAHLGMALVAGGDWETARAHLDVLRGRASGDDSGLILEVLVPLLDGLHAFAAGEYS